MIGSRARRAMGLLPVVGLLLIGCAAKPDKPAWQRYSDQLTPEVGKESIETYVKRWGTPSQRIDVQDGSLYCWRISQGSRSGGFAFFVAAGSSYEAYDDIRLKFDQSSVLRDWTVDCMR